MLELYKVGKKTYYVSGLFHVGIYEIEENIYSDYSYDDYTPVCLIDSGLDDEVAADIDLLLKENHFYVALIINTHYHADHCGGNTYFKNVYNCEILASSPNDVLISNYAVTPSMILGASPLNKVMSSYYYTTSTPAKDIQGRTLPDGLTLVDLAGHSISMIGVKTDDNVFFVGDGIIGEETISAHSIFYLYDVEAFYNSLTTIENIKASLYILYHGEPVTDISNAVAINRKCLDNNLELISNICSTPRTLEEIYSMLYKSKGYTTTLYRYSVEISVIKSLVFYLHNRGILSTIVDDNYIKWQKL